MRGWLYRLLVHVSRWLGIGLVSLFARLVATGYFLLLPRRLAVSLRLYRALFPERGRLHALACAWRQYHHFAGVFAERLRLQGGRAPSWESPGLELLQASAAAGQGGILVMSHVGSWEVAARLLRRRGLKLLLYMGARQREQIEGQQKDDLRREGVRVLAAGGGEDGAAAGSPFDFVEGLSFLRQGGFVSLAGDRLYNRQGRTAIVRFLGGRARLPLAPWALALVSGAPVFAFFALRLAPGRYRFEISPLQPVRAASRQGREEAMQQAAQLYADELAQVLRRHPEQWYCFEPFLEP